MKQVKGSMMIELVKNIRADKTGVYDQYLTDQDREIISKKILPSAWYPYETYKRLFIALFKVHGNNDVKTAYGWGHAYGSKSFGPEGVYRSIIIKADPQRTLRNYGIVYKKLLDFGERIMIDVSSTETHVKITEIDSDLEPYVHMLIGTLEYCIRLCGVENVKSEFLSKSWMGDEETVIKLTWDL